MTIDYHDVRTRVLKALYTDDELFDLFYLKGGAALLFYGIHDRASADIDVSMEEPFEMPLDEVAQRLERAMNTSFEDSHLQLIDFKLQERPKVIDDYRKSFWGGYKLDFKFVTKSDYALYKDDIDNLRRRVIKVMEGTKTGSRFQVDISNHEFCDGNFEELTIDGIVIQIYTPPLIVFEKLRAICQQNIKYKKISRAHQNGRPRDFFDIISIFEYEPGIEVTLLTAAYIDILKNVFQIKKVPLELLEDIKDSYDFHSTEFETVRNAVGPGKEVQEFDFYFSRVVNFVDQVLDCLNA